jgi:putative phosphoribosyl transferase
MRPVFRDRTEAGRRLASLLIGYAGKDAIVLALPRGGVPVAYEIAAALDLQLDVFLVRKLGLPGHEELAMGAIAGGGVRVLDEDVVRRHGVDHRVLEDVERRERVVLESRSRLYRGSRPEPFLRGRTVVLVDDGLATGSTMKAAVAAVRRERPARVVVAVPVAPEETVRELSTLVDEVACVATPEPFWGVGIWYERFPQTSDEEVQDLLARAPAAAHRAAS